ncbi:MAG: type II toxin-antitoxin system MqsA family antitoxin [Alphaproteobacteria bacterium]|jgi:HTH-type transcriptional regulator / antitoxin MqsA|nr:type II toxin-antitoxin system MqsA family antitoxin [Alphaproteobacteria bacterium]
MARTKIHPVTGATLRRDVRPYTVRYGGRTLTVDLPGWYPEDNGESLHMGRDMQASDEALKELRSIVGDSMRPAEVRAIRLRLKLSQRKAGDILGGGPRAFQKYESGEVAVSRPMAQLLRLLDRDPARLKELNAQAAE